MSLLIPTASPQSKTDLSRCVDTGRGRGIGVMFLAFFGSWWLYLGSSAFFGSVLALAAIAFLGGLLFLAGLNLSRRGGTHSVVAVAELARRSAAFRNVNIVQWSAIVALIAVLNLLGRPEWIAPGIMLIVGLHFFPLARLFRNHTQYLTGGALCLLAMSYPFLLPQGPANPFGPIAAGLILWAAALRMLTQRS